MSSIVKLAPNYKPLNILPEDRQFIRPTEDNLGILVGGRFTSLDGEPLSEDVVKANQIFKVTPVVPMRATKYNTLVSFNPALAEVATVSCPSILPPGHDISLVIRAFKQFEVAEFVDMYTFIIYAID